jgi:hypothetical protein
MSSGVDPDGEIVSAPWLKDIYGEFGTFMRQQHDFHHVMERSLVATRNAPDLVRALAEFEALDEVQNEETERARAERIAAADADSAIARSEIEGGFCTLNAQGIVLVWSALEALIDDMVRACLAHHQELLTGERIGRLKIPLSEVIGVSEETLRERVFEEVEREFVRGEGVTRFESLLSVVNLDGQTGEDLSRDIYTLQKVRNLIAHRRGYVDGRFVRDCPWLNPMLNERLNVALPLYMQLTTAAINYAIVVRERARAEYGVIRSDTEQDGGESI